MGALYPRARRLEDEALAISAILAARLGAGGTFADVGSNRGQVLADAVRVAPEARHVAFEPIPALAEELARRFPTVDCRRVALAAEPGSARYCHFTTLDGWSGLVRNPEISDEQGTPEFIEVRVSTLDDELPDGASVVKIDVEGAELGVLEGGRGMLARVQPLLLFEHVQAAAALYGASSEALWELLDGLGYRVFAVTGGGPYERSAFAAAEGIVNWLAAPRRPRDG